MAWRVHAHARELVCCKYFNSHRKPDQSLCLSWCYGARTITQPAQAKRRVTRKYANIQAVTIANMTIELPDPLDTTLTAKDAAWFLLTHPLWTLAGAGVLYFVIPRLVKACFLTTPEIVYPAQRLARIWKDLQTLWRFLLWPALIFFLGYTVARSPDSVTGVLATAISFSQSQPIVTSVIIIIGFSLLITPYVLPLILLAICGVVFLQPTALRSILPPPPSIPSWLLPSPIRKVEKDVVQSYQQLRSPEVQSPPNSSPPQLLPFQSLPTSEKEEPAVAPQPQNPPNATEGLESKSTGTKRKLLQRFDNSFPTSGAESKDEGTGDDQLVSSPPSRFSRIKESLKLPKRFQKGSPSESDGPEAPSPLESSESSADGSSSTQETNDSGPDPTMKQKILSAPSRLLKRKADKPATLFDEAPPPLESTVIENAPKEKMQELAPPQLQSLDDSNLAEQDEKIKSRRRILPQRFLQRRSEQSPAAESSKPGPDNTAVELHLDEPQLAPKSDSNSIPEDSGQLAPSVKGGNTSDAATSNSPTSTTGAESVREVRKRRTLESELDRDFQVKKLAPAEAQLVQSEPP